MKADLFLKICIGFLGIFGIFLSIFMPMPFRIHAQELPSFVISVAWSPDGDMIAGAGHNGLLRIWDATGQTLIDFQGLNGTVYSVVWSPDNTRIASAGSDRAIRVWDAQNGQLLATMQGHEDDVIELSWSPDGNSLASVSFDERYSVRTWNTNTYQPQAIQHAGNHYGISWSPDGTRLAVGAVNRVVILPSSLNILPSDLPGYVMGPTAETTSVAWNDDGRRLAIGRIDGSIYIWDTLDNIQLSILSGQTGWIDALAWHPDGNHLASSSLDGTIRIWNVSTGEVVNTFANPHEYLMQSISWSPNGNNLAYGGNGEGVHIVQVSSCTMPPGQPTLSVATNDIPGLIAAINVANAAPDPDIINLADGAYTLTSIDNTTDGPNGLPVITTPITIHGGACATLTHNTASSRHPGDGR